MTKPDLARIPLFARLTPVEQEKLLSLMVRKTFKDDTAVFFQDDPSDSLYVVLSGSAKVVRTSEDGKDRILKVFWPGEVFGELAMLEGLPRSATVQTTADSEMLVLARRDFEALAREQPDVLWKLLQAVCGRLREVGEDLLDQYRDMPYRVLKVLSQLLERHGESGPGGWRIRIPVSARDLSQMIGSNPETVSRQLETLERDGLLRRDGAHWSVPDRKAFARAFEHEASAS